MSGHHLYAKRVTVGRMIWSCDVFRFIWGDVGEADRA